MRLNSLMFVVEDLQLSERFWVERFGYRRKNRLLDLSVTLTAKEVDSAPDRFGEIWTDFDNKEQCMWHVDYHAPAKIILVDKVRARYDKPGLVRICYTTPEYEQVRKLIISDGFHIAAETVNPEPNTNKLMFHHPFMGVDIEIMEKKEWLSAQ